MKKTLLALTCTLALGACTTERIVERVPVTAPAQSSLSDKETLYLESVASEFPNVVNSLGKNFVLNFGYSSCEDIDKGMTLDDLFNMTKSSGADPGAVGYMVGEAIRIFCPDNQWFLDGAESALRNY